MRRVEKQLRAKQKCFMLGVLVGIVASVLAIVTMDYVAAVRDKARCEEGWDECVIEWDGVLDGFNVYYK